jgi:hypothetical protein
MWPLSFLIIKSWHVRFSHAKGPSVNRALRLASGRHFRHLCLLRKGQQGGTPVESGPTPAMVLVRKLAGAKWTAPGGGFFSFGADGTMVSSSNNEVVTWVALDGAWIIRKLPPVGLMYLYLSMTCQSLRLYRGISSKSRLRHSTVHARQINSYANTRSLTPRPPLRDGTSRYA